MNYGLRIPIILFVIGIFISPKVISSGFQSSQDPDGIKGNLNSIGDQNFRTFQDDGDDQIYMEVFSEDGSITRIQVPPEIGVMAKPLTAPPSAEVITIQSSGANTNRVDLVFIGDGYTSAELDIYSQHVQNRWNEIISTEPFATYKDYFNVYQVNVISPESGVDNDPWNTNRETALDMTFWCAGMDRLLCVDVSKAWQYASNAPGVDQIIVLANSNQYGGGGYSVYDIATSSGGHSFAGEIVLHELGHSFGDLADEYEYNPGSSYTGPEPNERNISVYSHPDMISRQTKWYRWIGEPSPDGGEVDTFEGAAPGSFGVYRPTYGSLMRVLGKPFNLPSREGMVIALYQSIHPIDDNTPTKTILNGTETVFVTPFRPVGHALNIIWSLDSQIIPTEQDQEVLDLQSLTWECRESQILSAKVVDNTSFVRDSSSRDQFLTDTRTWTVQRVEEIQIDIKPGETPNSININGRGVIPVAVLGSENFDITQIDTKTLRFEGLSVKQTSKGKSLCASGNWNEDEFRDLVCHFVDDLSKWTGSGDTASVTGNLYCGTIFSGNDTFKLVP
jgi:IgA Peptidase M64